MRAINLINIILFPAWLVFLPFILIGAAEDGKALPTPADSLDPLPWFAVMMLIYLPPLLASATIIQFVARFIRRAQER